LVDQAFADRRLFKMVLSREAGGLEAARARYAAEPSPPLLLVELDENDGDLMAHIDALGEVCVAGTNLILFGHRNEVELYRALIRRGVADYLVLPAEPVRLIEAVLDLYAEPGAAGSGRVIAFVGAKGGVGSSTLATNTGCALARIANADVVVVDLDLPFGAADLVMNLEAIHGVHTVLADPDRIDDGFLGRFAAKYNDRLHLLAAPCALDGDAAMAGAALENVIHALKQQAHYVLLDVPHLWADWVRTVLLLADQVVLVAAPDLPSIRNCRNLIDFLATGRSMDLPPVLVLNRVGLARKGEVPNQDFGTSVGLAPALVIGDEPELFARAAAEGKMIEEVSRKAKASVAIGQLAKLVAALPATKAEAKPTAAGSLLARLLRRKG
jgi:pilus assembly protein CpaE